MSIIAKKMLLAAAGAGGGDANFISTLNESSFQGSRSIAVDSQNNIIAIGGTQLAPNGSTRGVLIVKTNAAGQVLFTKGFSVTNRTSPQCLAVDSSDNIIFCCLMSNTGPNNEDHLGVVKLDSSGSIVWQKYLEYPYKDYVTAICTIDSSDNVIVAAWGEVGYRYAYNMTKFDSSGSLVFKKIYYSGSSTIELNSCATDSSGNIYFVGENDIASAQLVKLSSTGTLLAERYYDGTISINTGFKDAVIDSSGNIYCPMALPNAGSGLIKINSSLSVVWAFYSSSIPVGRNIALDSSNNVLIGHTYSGTTTMAFSKFDGSTGSLIWSRKVDGSNNDEPGEAKGIVVDQNDNVISAGYLNDGTYNRFAIVKVPSDGSGTGTYGPYSYATISPSFSSRSISTGTKSYTYDDSPATVNTLSLSVNTPSLTQVFYEI